MTGEAQLLPGTLGLLILKAVSLGHLHGYGVFLRIQQVSGRSLLIEQGAFYPALIRLVRQGVLEATWGISDNNRRARFYELTKRAAGDYARKLPVGIALLPRSRPSSAR
jgi:DNA-binding PadR family transcriptional regulator